MIKLGIHNKICEGNQYYGIARPDPIFQVSKARTEIVCALEFYLMKRLDDRSRMKREFHVQFCESL